MVKLIECPRDAMQGLHDFIETDVKINYINQLLQVGFDTLDFGSFVSPKAIPQMRDTADVLNGLKLSGTKTKLLAIVANTRGAEDAAEFDEINYLGFPFSISETFQQRNTNSSIEESLKRVEEIQQICISSKKTLVVYISMAFGNPYGDSWSPEIATKWSKKLQTELGIKILALADTTGVSDPDNITELFGTLIPELKGTVVGAHLHSTPTKVVEKISAAYSAGCRRFDGAIRGFGGCPMAADQLTGNMPTEEMKKWFDENKISTNLNTELFNEAFLATSKVFPN